MYESEQPSRAEKLAQKRSYWKQHIQSWQSSQMTQTEYCRQHELKPHCFTYWKRRFVQTDTGIHFVPVKTHRYPCAPPHMNPSTLRLIIGGDIQVEVRADFDPGLLRRLLATIRSLP